MDAAWYYASNKKKIGPLSWRELQQAAARGEVKPVDMILGPGSKRWVEARSVPGLFAQAKLVASPPPALKPATPRAGARARRLSIALAAGAVLILAVAATWWFWPRADKTPGPLAANPLTPHDEALKPEPGPDPKLAAQALAKLNDHRRKAGLADVALNVELSEGCQAHARYLLRNKLDPDVRGEEAGKPGYTKVGNAAAEIALAFAGAPLVALDAWLARAAPRLLLLHPNLHTVGLGAVGDANDWRTVLDIERGRRETVVVYPAADQTDVPLHFAGGPELPIAFNKQNAGFPISATFPPYKNVSQGKAELTRAGQATECWVSTPAQPLAPRVPRNTLCLIPKEPLEANATYAVTMTAQVDGVLWRKTWHFKTGEDLDESGAWARKALARINAFRKRAGVEPVVLDEALTEGCRKHARYIVMNLDNPRLAGLGAHDEDPKLPGYSEEGKKAGKGGNIALGDHDPLAALDGWLATLYHRIPLLDPRLRRIGFCCARGPRLGWYSVLDVASGREPRPLMQALTFPASDQKDVPLSFPAGGEIPDPIPDDTDGRAGYPITLTLPRADVPEKATGVLEDVAGNTIDVWFSTPEKPANPRFATFQGPNICLIPKDPLKPHTTYKVKLEGMLKGSPWQKSWSFTTGPDSSDPAAEVSEVLSRINRYRAAAGLAAVTLDPASSKACRAHADYLLRHGSLRKAGDFNPNEEDASLPGYTKEGAAAAARADVFLEAPAPWLQIDLIHASFSRRVFLLDPNLRTVGFGCAMEVGRGWACVLDLNSGRALPAPVLYPAPNQANLPVAGLERLTGAGKESGFPITVTFAAPLPIRAVGATLHDSEGRAVDILVASPEQPLELHPENTVVIVPRAPLQAGTTYRVHVRLLLAGQVWERSWEFATKP